MKLSTLITAILILSGCSSFGWCYRDVGIYQSFGDTPTAKVILERDRHLYPNRMGYVSEVVKRYNVDGFRSFRASELGDIRTTIGRWLEKGYWVSIEYARHAEVVRSVSDLVWWKKIKVVHVTVWCQGVKYKIQESEIN